MAHFAKINDENRVLAVHAVNNSDIQNSEGVETESIGQAYLEKHSNWPANKWIQTSINTVQGVHKNGGTPLRGNYAGIGFIWDSENEIFLPPKPHASWTKDVTNARWVSPLGDPPALTESQQADNEGGDDNHIYWQYRWDESAYQADNTTGWVIENLGA
tara:strand:+ start:371 stop:847 length:477 start_codon:yes stop_codon:yes gene_type:complete